MKRMGLFFAISVFCLWVGVEYCAGQSICPTILLPSDVLPSIDDTNVTSALTERIAKLQQEVPALFRHNQIDVYSIAVVYRNTIIYSDGLVDTPFRIGSITKVFTAMGALMLRKRGLLNLDDPVKKFLPTFSVVNPYDDEHDITLRELMGHLSGLPRYLCRDHVCGSPSEEENLYSIAKMQLARPPWSFIPNYSNLGFAILGHAWEKATSPRKSWSEFIKDEISTPLEMHDTGVDLARVKLAPGDLHPYPSNTSRGWRGPDGEMYSTALDLAKFLKFLLSRNPKLLSATEIREWTHPTTIFQDTFGIGYALPWELARYLLLTANLSIANSFTLITKGGGIGTFHSSIAFHPDSQLGIAVLTSVNDTSNPNITSAASRIAFETIRQLIPDVQSVHAKIISGIYSGVYICRRSDNLIVSPHPANATIQVLEGYIDVHKVVPGDALTADYNVTVTMNGLRVTLANSVPLLLKPAPKHSFWAYPGNCFSQSGLVSSDADKLRPNFEGSAYFRELRFEPSEKMVRWPSIGAECYVEN